MAARAIPPNARGEWRRANDAEMQTQTLDRHPLHCARYAPRYASSFVTRASKCCVTSPADA
jgi:hypothetical protein